MATTKLVPINPNSNQISRSNSQKSLGTKSSGSGGQSGGNKTSMNDFKPLNVLVFKNGDQYDPGLEMSVTRKQFKNWINLLDYLTDKLKMTEGAVHKLYAYPAGVEVRHFSEMEQAGRYFVAANGKYKNLKYGKYPRLPNFNTFPINKSPRQNPPTLNSTDSMEYYLKSHGFKPKLGDVWQDTEFNLKKKRNPNRSLSVNANDQMQDSSAGDTIVNSGSFLDKNYSPERSRSEFNAKSTNWETEKTEFDDSGGGMTEFALRGEPSTFSAKRSQSVANVQENYDHDKRDDFKMDSEENLQSTQRRFSAATMHSHNGEKFGDTYDDRKYSLERLKTATVVAKKRNIKLQTETTETETSKSAEQLLRDEGVNTDNARFAFSKREKSFVDDYWKNKETKIRQNRERPENLPNTGRANNQQRNSKNESLDRLNRQRRPNTVSYPSRKKDNSENLQDTKKIVSTVPKNKISTYNDFISSTKKPRTSRKDAEKSPRWAEDLTVAVRELTDRVDQLSARSKPPSRGYNNDLFDDDED